MFFNYHCTTILITKFAVYRFIKHLTSSPDIRIGRVHFAKLAYFAKRRLILLLTFFKYTVVNWVLVAHQKYTPKYNVIIVVLFQFR